MEIESDPAKDAIDVAEHGVSPARAAEMDKFRATGRGWLPRINAALRAALVEQPVAE